MIVLHRSYRISQTVFRNRPTPLSCQVVGPSLGVSHISVAMLRTITMNNLCFVGDRDITFRLDSSPVPVWTLEGSVEWHWRTVSLSNALRTTRFDDCLENYLPAFIPCFPFLLTWFFFYALAKDRELWQSHWLMRISPARNLFFSYFET